MMKFLHRDLRLLLKLALLLPSLSSLTLVSASVHAPIKDAPTVTQTPSPISISPSDTASTLESESDRPAMVLEAIANNTAIYYFGVGSNLSKDKLIHRAMDGEGPINFQSMEPAYVRDHRLAFNLRGFPPLEPAMGSIEPVNSSDHGGALLPYTAAECHGALIRLTGREYARVMRSEGVGGPPSSYSRKGHGYEEVMVDAIPYGSNKSVKAITLRGRPLSRMKVDKCPSPRYMDLIKTGAEELGLRDTYKDWLHNHPVQVTPRLIQKMAVYNMIWSFGILSKVKYLGWVSRLQSSFLHGVYVPSDDLYLVRRVMHIVATAVILFPGAVMGAVKVMMSRLTGKPMSPMLTIMLERYG